MSQRRTTRGGQNTLTVDVMFHHARLCSKNARVMVTWSGYNLQVRIRCIIVEGKHDMTFASLELIDDYLTDLREFLEMDLEHYRKNSSLSRVHCTFTDFPSVSLFLFFFSDSRQ